MLLGIAIIYGMIGSTSYSDWTMLAIMSDKTIISKETIVAIGGMILITITLILK
jgi:hypothetical protein